MGEGGADTSKDGEGGGEGGEANATKGLVMLEPCKFIHTKERSKRHIFRKTRKKIKEVKKI